MKTLALLLISVLGFAQTPDRAPSSLHLLDKTNPSAKREVSSATAPTVNYAQFCFDKAASSKDETWKYDQALQDCVGKLHRDSKVIGHGNCHRIASAVSDGNIRNEMRVSCEDYYGYEGCLAASKTSTESAAKKSVRKCIIAKSSSLSPAECEEELKKHDLLKEQDLMRLCKNGSDAVMPSKVSSPTTGKKSSK